MIISGSYEDVTDGAFKTAGNLGGKETATIGKIIFERSSHSELQVRKASTLSFDFSALKITDVLIFPSLTLFRFRIPSCLERTKSSTFRPWHTCILFTKQCVLNSMSYD